MHLLPVNKSIAMKIGLSVLLFFIMINARSQPGPGFNKQASLALIKRIVPALANRFAIEYIAKENDKDVFELESKGNTILLRGNDGISIASALNYYLKHYAHVDIGFNATKPQVPIQLPAVPEKVRKVSPHA